MEAKTVRRRSSESEKLHWSIKGKEKFTVEKKKTKAKAREEETREQKSFGERSPRYVSLYTDHCNKKHEQESSKIEQVFICKFLPLLHLIPS
jgi:hypothetical protein